MPFHLAAFGPINKTIGGTVVIPPAGDPLLGEFQASYILPPGLNRVLAAAAIMTDTAVPKLASSTLDPQLWQSIIPVNSFAGFGSIPAVQTFFDERVEIPPWTDLFLNPSDPLTNGASNTVLVWLGEMELQPPHPAPIIHAYFTGTVNLVLNNWSPTTMNFAQYLEDGDYAVIGAAVVPHLNNLAFRLVPSSGSLYRPGGVSSLNFDQLVPDWQRDGRLGEWMRFNFKEPPSLEIFGQAGASGFAVAGVLDLVKLQPEEPNGEAEV